MAIDKDGQQRHLGSPFARKDRERLQHAPETALELGGLSAVALARRLARLTLEQPVLVALSSRRRRSWPGSRRGCQ